MVDGSFISSVDPDISESIPLEISARTDAPIYVAKGVLADVSIGGLPFRLALTDQNPYMRETSDFRRQQIDTSKEPGEQTLAQWWVRDQESWHHGAGITYYEPGSQDDTQYRYDSSIGVDVWTQGQATLLHSMTVLRSATGGQTCYATPAKVGGEDVLFSTVGASLTRSNGATSTTYSGAAGTEPVIAGSKVLSGTTSGIMAGDTTGTVLSALWTSTGPLVRPYWIKSRIIATKANKLYELDLVGGSLDTKIALYEHPDPSWTWTAVAEAPGAIVASGYSNGYGLVYRLALTDPGDGGTPVLGAASQVADFPPGEEVHAIRSYLSTYLAIGTTRGVRIGLMDADGTLQYGPLIVKTTQPVRCFGARDSYIYAGIEADIDGSSGCARIDLSEAITDLRYPWAYDASTHTPGVVQSVAFLGTTDRVALGVAGRGVWLQSATGYEQSGYILSGRIRYSTSEPKSYDRVKIRSRIPSGCGVSLSTVNQQGTTEFLIRMGDAFNTDEDITLRTIADRAQAYASILLTLESDEDGTGTPILESMQVKATPTPRIQRLIRYPVFIQDREEDRNGQKQGRTGSAALRLRKLEELEESHSTVIVQDFTNGEAYSGQIRSIQFTRDTPPSRNRPNFGGTAQITVLKL